MLHVQLLFIYTKNYYITYNKLIKIVNYLKFLSEIEVLNSNKSSKTSKQLFDNFANAY